MILGSLTFTPDHNLTPVGVKLKRALLALRIRRSQCTIAFDGFRPLRFYREQWVTACNDFHWRNVLIVNGTPIVWRGRPMTDVELAP